jgi:hypothetical protein
MYIIDNIILYIHIYQTIVCLIPVHADLQQEVGGFAVDPPPAVVVALVVVVDVDS